MAQIMSKFHLACRRRGVTGGEIKLLPFASNPSVSLAAASSPCTGEAVGRGDIKIYTL